MSVIYPPDLTTPVGQIRALIPDQNPEYFLFQDEDLSFFHEMEGAVRLGVALALETMASNMALVDKVMELHDLKTDSQKTAQTLLDRAELLRKQATGTIIIQYGAPSLTIPEDPLDYNRRMGVRGWV